MVRVHGACVWCVCVYGACVCMVRVCVPVCVQQRNTSTLYAQGMSEVKQLSQNIDHCGMHYTCDHEATSSSRVTVPPEYIISTLRISINSI